MARQRTAVQVNQFVGGLNTEANPLSFPVNNSLDEENMILRANGERWRRWGFNTINTSGFVGPVPDSSKNLGRSAFLWLNPSGFSEWKVMVTQIGQNLILRKFKRYSTTVSEQFLYANNSFLNFTASEYDKNFDYAVINNDLLIVTGAKNPSVITFDGTNFTKTDRTLYIRDLFGVEETGDALTEPLNYDKRPTTLSSTHLYNLRNQTFALPRVEGDADTQNLIDPIAEFYLITGSTVYPSNADSVNKYLTANANLASNRTIDRFNANDMWKTPPGNSRASMGHFIIDALDRGQSRRSEEASLRARNPTLSLAIVPGDLPDDITFGGPSVVAAYAGRAWYAGFSSSLTDPDVLSPRMNNYVLYSQLVDNTSKLSECYQEGDPTVADNADVVDTDGGFILIDEAINIKALVPFNTSLFVFAENGVWQISGIDNNIFTATSFSITKLGPKGCISGPSVVTAEDAVYYWGYDGIYRLGPDQVGEVTLQNITQETIQSYYDSISFENKQVCQGDYDTHDKVIRWIFGANPYAGSDTYELILHTKFAAFTKNRIPTVKFSSGSLDSIGPILFINDKEVNYSGISGTPTAFYPSETNYLFIEDNNILFSCDWSGYIGRIYNTCHDFSNAFDGGIDTPAYLVTGPINIEENRLRKEIPYVSVFFERTNPTGLITSLDSSCYLSAQWGWTTDSATSKWSTPRQAYRLLRMDDGVDMVVTRNKLRGADRAVSLKFESEDAYLMRIRGWEFNLQAGETE